MLSWSKHERTDVAWNCTISWHHRRRLHRRHVCDATGADRSNRPAFSIFNAIGAAFILVSLYFEFNLSAALMEGVWLLVSLYGLWRALRPAKRIAL